MPRAVTTSFNEMITVVTGNLWPT